MLENDDANLQSWSAYNIKYFQNNPILKSRDRTSPPDLPTLKAYPTPGEGCSFFFFFFFFFSLKWREWMNLKVPGAISSLSYTFWVPWRNCLGVVATPLRRTRVKPVYISQTIQINKISTGERKKISIVLAPYSPSNTRGLEGVRDIKVSSIPCLYREYYANLLLLLFSINPRQPKPSFVTRPSAFFSEISASTNGLGSKLWTIINYYLEDCSKSS